MKVIRTGRTLTTLHILKDKAICLNICTGFQSSGKTLVNVRPDIVKMMAVGPQNVLSTL